MQVTIAHLGHVGSNLNSSISLGSSVRKVDGRKIFNFNFIFFWINLGHAILYGVYTNNVVTVEIKPFIKLTSYSHMFLIIIQSSDVVKGRASNFLTML